jgi:lipoprotein NlpD
VHTLKQAIIIMLAVFLWGCMEDNNLALAPVVDASSIERIPANGLHRVHAGETLYSIAWRYGLDYRDLALRNNLNASPRLHTGQIIYLRGSPPNVVTPVVTTEKIKFSEVGTPTAVKKLVSKNYFESNAEPNAAVNYWQWPARGRVTGTFSTVNKGINISGKLSQPIYAAAAGKVVYSGHGLRGYGNLIIIKHNSTFLTAYAHNRKNLVTEGEWVKIGQIIAEMGNTGSRSIMLHFEIRREGVPVNPLDYLSNR